MWEANIPGGFDKLNFYTGRYDGGKYDIPLLLEEEDFMPKGLVSFKNTLRPKKHELEECVHFFLEDYHFESVWNNPIKSLSRIQKIGQALTPDYSLYMDMPKVLQMYNVYRNRWIGRFWQENGIKVIPTVSWSDEESFDFCFEGIPRNSAVALSTVGIKRENYHLFAEGFDVMYQLIEPRKVILYGEKEIVNFEEYDTQLIKYDSYWKKVRQEL